MKRSIKTAIFIGIALITAFAIVQPGYGQKRKDRKRKEKPPEGYLLQYNFPAGKPVAYSAVSKIEQSMEVNGETMSTNVDVVFACTVTAIGKENNNLKLEVKIDTLSTKIDSPMGASGGLITDLAGKSFNMLLAPNGKEIDLKEAEKLTYSSQGSMETNVAESFFDYFPDMPVKSIKPGDTWISNDTIKMKTGSGSVKQIVNSNNKFEGIINMEGVDCAKITATHTGTREQQGEAQGMDINIKGDFTGTSELYFDMKDGYLVKEISTSKMIGTLDISGAQNMSMPLTSNMISNKFLKK